MRFRRFALAVSVMALLANATPTLASPESRNWTDVRSFSDTSVVGWSTLLRHADSVQMTLHTTGLPAGKVVTVWWIIFNHPEFCQFGEAPVPATGFAGTKCGPGDLGIVPGLTSDPRVDPAVVHAAGHVIGSTGTGTYAGYLSVGAPRQQVLLGTGLSNPIGADIHFVVHGHDAGTGDMHLGQEIQTFGATAGTDLQFAAHEAS